MKTEPNKIHTQIADISVNGRELNEENLRIVAGGGRTLYPRPTRYPTQSGSVWVVDCCD